MKITKTKLKQIIKEELSEVFKLGVRGPVPGGEEQAAAEKEMEKYLIDNGIYKANRHTGQLAIMTGIVEDGEKALMASGQFEPEAIRIFINKLHELIR